MKLASWNVNSLKVRLEQVLSLLEDSNLDVLALQETKTIDDNFPIESFTELGYNVNFAGQKTYNGVAIISKEPQHDVITDLTTFSDPQRRILAVTIGDTRVINLYVPNGSSLESDKFVYKLNWLEKVSQFIKQQLAQYPNLAVVGDFNIAPEDIDVHDINDWTGDVLVSEPERTALKEIMSYGLHDSYRKFTREENEFSWWDYRAANFRRNRGLRIDLILLSDSLLAKCTESIIIKDCRKHERPSDHAPVVVSI
ncbi:MAG: exodeoxyribonuclease III [Legionellaceae bacterium]|nr:exodeoxyribonuclease III [Legionellaceae bacterium]